MQVYVENVQFTQTLGLMNAYKTTQYPMMHNVYKVNTDGSVDNMDAFVQFTSDNTMLWYPMQTNYSGSTYFNSIPYNVQFRKYNKRKLDDCE